MLVRDGKIVGRGCHTWAGVKHAEILALEEAGENARGATLYVSLEPCSHHGRTGPCTEASIAAGVSRVVAAMADPNPLVSGVGLRRLREAGVTVEVSASTPGGRQDQRGVSALHGTGSSPGDPQGGRHPRREDLRARRQPGLDHERDGASRMSSSSVTAADAILTGIGTVLADDCLMTDRTGLERSRPLLRIVLDSRFAYLPRRSWSRPASPTSWW